MTNGSDGVLLFKASSDKHGKRPVISDSSTVTTIPLSGYREAQEKGAGCSSAHLLLSSPSSRPFICLQLSWQKKELHTLYDLADLVKRQGADLVYKIRLVYGDDLGDVDDTVLL